MAANHGYVPSLRIANRSDVAPLLLFFNRHVPSLPLPSQAWRVAGQRCAGRRPGWRVATEAWCVRPTVLGAAGTSAATWVTQSPAGRALLPDGFGDQSGYSGSIPEFTRLKPAPAPAPARFRPGASPGPASPGPASPGLASPGPASPAWPAPARPARSGETPGLRVRPGAGVPTCSQARTVGGACVLSGRPLRLALSP